jgi:multidrug efflux system outer membrane protein
LILTFVISFRHSLPLTAVLFAACTAAPPATQPPLPDSVAPGTDWTASYPGKTKAEPTAWLEQFDDASLRAVVREAVAQNPDLHAAAARMRQARIRAVRDGAARLPELTGGLRAAQSGERAGGWNFGNDYALSLDVSWEADVWGRVRDTTSASVASARAAEADYAAARLSLAANAAKAWCNLQEAEAQVSLGRQTVETFRRGLTTVDRAFDKGVPGVTALDIRLARSSLASGESNLQARLRARDEAQRTLESLLGRYPSGVVKTSGRLPGLRSSVPAGVPSTLLLRRPDILAAERRIAAAQRREDAARKALLPSFRLSTGADTGGPRLSDLFFDERKLAASLLQSLTQPLYRGGALRADVRLSEAERQELVSGYAATAIEAFREVETAMAAEGYIAEQIKSQRTFVKESVESERLAISEYEKGLQGQNGPGVLRLLEAQRRAFDSQSGLLRLENQLLQARIDLCLALGGGF